MTDDSQDNEPARLWEAVQSGDVEAGISALQKLPAYAEKAWGFIPELRRRGQDMADPLHLAAQVAEQAIRAATEQWFYARLNDSSEAIRAEAVLHWISLDPGDRRQTLSDLADRQNGWGFPIRNDSPEITEFMRATLTAAPQQVRSAAQKLLKRLNRPRPNKKRSL